MTAIVLSRLLVVALLAEVRPALLLPCTPPLPLRVYVRCGAGWARLRVWRDGSPWRAVAVWGVDGRPIAL